MNKYYSNFFIEFFFFLKRKVKQIITGLYRIGNVINKPAIHWRKQQKKENNNDVRKISFREKTWERLER